jgi:hypothetical protein
MPKCSSVRDFILLKLTEYKNNEVIMGHNRWEFKVIAYECVLKRIEALPENTTKIDITNVAGKSITKKIKYLIEEYNEYMNMIQTIQAQQKIAPVHVTLSKETPEETQSDVFTSATVPVPMPLCATVPVPMPLCATVPVPMPLCATVPVLESTNISLSIRLLQALSTNDTNVFRKYIVDVNTCDKVSGTSWIHWAAYANKPDIIELLVELGADIEVKAQTIGTIKLKREMTPIQVAKHFKSHLAFIKLYQLSKNTNLEYTENNIDEDNDRDKNEPKSVARYLISVIRNLFNWCA